MVSYTPRPLYPRVRDLVPLVQETEWASRLVSTAVENLAPHWDSNLGPSNPYYAIQATGFQKYAMKILLADLVTNLGREYIFKPTLGHRVCTKTSNENGVEAVSVAMYKILTAKSTS